MFFFFVFFIKVTHQSGIYSYCFICECSHQIYCQGNIRLSQRKWIKIRGKHSNVINTARPNFRRRKFGILCKITSDLETKHTLIVVPQGVDQKSGEIQKCDWTLQGWVFKMKLARCLVHMEKQPQVLVVPSYFRWLKLILLQIYSPGACNM